ncbi:MAG TPA: pilus assembly protein TadG-related protein [Candidatus Binataceae bacterium]|nr:pilus assembly protein TadG-related protein [Candidatus Binataceae bacterium]
MPSEYPHKIGRLVLRDVHLDRIGIRRIRPDVLQRIRHRHPGQTFLLISIAIAMLVGIAAVAVDVGNLWTTRRLMQSAADAGAVAGADEIAIGGGSSQITTAAKDASSHNGFADGGTRPGTSNTVAVHNPPKGRNVNASFHRVPPAL